TQVSGRVSGRAFSLSTSAGAGDTGEMGVQQITIRLELHSAVPPQLEIRKVEGVFGALARAVDEGTRPTGDADFDQWFVVSGLNQEELARVLNPEQKRVLEELAGESGQACVGIEDGALFWSDREIVSRLSELEGYLAELLQAAAAFDAAARADQEHQAGSAV
ncbi:MAG: hypothetical protein KDA79_11720, partial [Planctomycetaceae bacterium]|nr:hypothetical protein [Planctomycetaceae bacterium]